MNSSVEKNIIMMGINLESQLLAIKKFIEKKKRKRQLFFIQMIKNQNILKKN